MAQPLSPIFCHSSSAALRAFPSAINRAEATGNPQDYRAAIAELQMVCIGLPDHTRPTRNLSCEPRRSSQALTRSTGADKRTGGGMVSSVVPNASGKLISGQRKSTGGKVRDDFGRHSDTPGNVDNSEHSAS